MDVNKLLQRLHAYKKNPDFIKPLENNELAELVLALLGHVKNVEQAVEKGVLKGDKGDDGYTPKPDKDYLTVPTAKKRIDDLFAKAEQRIKDGKDGKDGRDGKDAEVTIEHIREAAQLAKDMIELPDFDELITQEPGAIRNALELLSGEDRLSIDAIAGLTEELDKLARTTGSQSTGAVIARRLNQIMDVNVEGATNGQALIYNSTTKTWEAGDVSSLPEQTGNSGKFLTTDGTDASWATLAGGGDMAVAVYDPQAIGADAFDVDNHTDGTTNKVYTATEKTKLAGIETGADVTDTANVTAAGALMDSEVTNLAQVKAFNSADYAAASHTHTASDIDAGVSTDGYVLTSDGAGNAAWEAASATVASLNNVGDVTITTVANDEVLQYTGAGWENQTLAEAGIQGVLSEGAFVDGDKTKLNGIETGADVTDTTNVTAAGALMDSEVDADIKTLSLPANTTISAFGATLVDDVDAATARTTLGVDAAGTDNSTDVTLAGTPDYITITGQTITRNQIDLTADVTGVLPEANLPDASGTAQGVVELATSAEINTGTDTGRAIPVDQFVASKYGSSSLVSSINFVIDGGGSAITTGVKGYIEIPFACTINQVTLLADQSGSIVVDIWKDTYANYPPTDADSITASAVPTISTATKSQDATLTGWTTSISAGDILGFNVDSITTHTRVTLSLKVTRT